MSEVVIDLGCGPNKKDPSWIGVDNTKIEGVNIIHDLLDFPYPFKDNYADMIVLSHVLEHFTIEEQDQILSEVHRILKVGSIVNISVPHAWSSFGIGDRSHKVNFSFWSFRDYVPAYNYNALKSPFKVVRVSGSVCAFKEDTPNTPAHKKCMFYNSFIDNWLSEIFTFILRKTINRLPSFADNLVKYLPVYGVSINVHLKKF